MLNDVICKKKKKHYKILNGWGFKLAITFNTNLVICQQQISFNWKFWKTVQVHLLANAFSFKLNTRVYSNKQ